MVVSAEVIKKVMEVGIGKEKRGDRGGAKNEMEEDCYHQRNFIDDTAVGERGRRTSQGLDQKI